MDVTTLCRFGHLTFIMILALWSFNSMVKAQSYYDVHQLQNDLLGNNYSTTIRPILNQSEMITLTPYFSLVAIADVDEVQQKIVVNGFIILVWKDELLTWDPSSYNGIRHLHIDPVSIWRPRFVLLNTMDERDMFEDDYAPLTVDFQGTVSWAPGGLFPALCPLDLRKFPFDEHECRLDLGPMYMSSSEVEFNMSLAMVLKSLFIESGEWTLKGTSISTELLTSHGLQNYVVRVELTMQRKSAFFIINIFCPVLFLCALNVLTFVIPVDAGEKIGFSITVLLAMAVYMGTIGDTLPSNSEKMPFMTHYIFYLFTLSVLCCMDTIAIVWLHHKEEEEEKKQSRQSKLRGILSKLNVINTFKSSTDKTKISPSTPGTEKSLTDVETVADDNLIKGLQVPARDHAFSDSLDPKSSGKVSFQTPTVIQRLKSGVSRTLSARRDRSEGRRSVNRYKNMAAKLNYYSAIIFGTASVFTTSVILILITT